MRALGVNFGQLGITLATGKLWPLLFGGHSSLFSLSLGIACAAASLAWFVGTFFNYWRTASGICRASGASSTRSTTRRARIEILTSFYKHPVEIGVNALLSAVILYPLLGCSLLARSTTSLSRP